MEGRPPLDPDDELDFDFDTVRKRGGEGGAGTDEHELEPLSDDDDGGEGGDAEPRRRGRPRFPQIKAPRIRLPSGIGGIRRKPRGDSTRRRAGSETGAADVSDAAGSGYGTGETAYDTGETAYETGETAYGTGSETAYDTGERPDETGERAYETGAGTVDTGESPYATDTGTAPPRDTAEQRLLRDDPYTPAEVPVPGFRRSRRRDLPAKVRRRQAIGIGAVAVLLVGGAALAFSGGGSDEPEPIPVKRLVGQSIIGKLGKGGVNPELLKRVRKGRLGGVIVEPRNEQQVQAGVAQLQEAAEAGGNPPLLILIDQEGGSVKRLPNGPPEVSPAQLGREGDADAARSEGEATGDFLASVGVNVDLAPVLDVRLPQTADTIADRTFGDDPAVVAELGSAFIEGLQSNDVGATGKHFPGLGPATINTDFSPVTVAARQEDLDAAQQPFEAAIDAGVKLIMMSSAAYPSLAGPSPGEGGVQPAVFAEPIVNGLLRQQLGFDGVVITDDLESIAIKELTNRDTAAVSALAAGNDLALYARTENGSTQGFNAVVRAVKQGNLDRATVEQAYDRIQTLKGEVAGG